MSWKLLIENIGTVNYEVYRIETVKGNDFSCTKQNTDGKRMITLITCASNNRNNRLVIQCVEKL